MKLEILKEKLHSTRLSLYNCRDLLDSIIGHDNIDHFMVESAELLDYIDKELKKSL